MSRVRAFRAQTHIVLWTFACILPMLAGALFATWRLADAQRHADRQQILQTAHVLSAAVDLKLEKGMSALAALGTSPALAGNDLGAFYAQCAAVARQHNAVIALVDSDNRRLLNTARPFGTALPRVHHDRAQQALAADRPMVSGLFESSVLNRLQVATYMPVHTALGRRVVLVMVIDIDEIGRVLAAQHLPATWTVTVADRDGRILARDRAIDRFAGVLLGERLRGRLARAMDGTYYGVNREGTHVLGAFTKSALSGWAVVIGIPLAEINAPLVKSLATTIAVTLILLVIAAAAAGLVGRRFAHWLRTLRGVALGVAQGAPAVPVRSSIAEVNDLGDSLQAAAALADRRARELAQQTATLAMLIEHMPVAVGLVSADLRYLAFNRFFLEQMGLEPGELKVGDSVEKFVRYGAACGDYGPGDVETLVRERLALLSPVRAVQFERPRADGRIFDVRITPLPDGGFISTRVDVTERRRREIEIEQARERLERHAAELTVARMEADRARVAADAANTAKSLFLANMSHELRTPLNAILGFSEIIASGSFGNAPARYQQYGRDIHVSGEHLLRLINDLLDQSRIEIGQLALEDKVFAVAPLIEECRQVVAGRAERGGVGLSVFAAPGLPLLRADRGRIKQVLINLLSNAVKFTRPGGCVRATARRTAEGGLALAVVDSGIGMRPEDIPSALEPFRQIDNSLARNYEGAGLGLSLARALTEMHGGRLEIRSEVAKGTLATVILPPARVIEDAPERAAAVGD